MLHESFINGLVSRLIELHPLERLYKVQVVFPHHGMGLYFNEYLSQKIENPQWSPVQLTFPRWATNTFNPQIQIPDTYTLLLELWTVYKTYFPEENLEKFWSWGKNLLDDLNEIDLQAIDPLKLFRYTSDWLKLETNWSEILEDTAPESTFWKLFAGKNSEMQSRFLQLWDKMPLIYQSYHARLEQNNQMYEGLLYRRLYENIDEAVNRLTVEITSDLLESIWFVGFHQLSKTEQRIIAQTKKGLGDNCFIWFDVDKYYADNPFMQAGYFYRKNTQKELLPDETPFDVRSDTLSNGKKNFTLFASPTPVTQAKSLSGILEEHLQDHPNDQGKTVVVLPDENLLFTLLSSLPENINSFNVTLGFPAKLSTFQSLIDSLIQLQSTKIIKDKLSYFNFKHVVALADHPYLHELKRVANFLPKRKMIWVSGEDLHQCYSENGEEVPVIVSMIFQPVETPLEYNGYLQNILAFTIEKLNQRGGIQQIELELTYLYLSILLRLEDLIENYQIQNEVTLTWWGKLLYQMIYSARLPFTGEPLQGVQILSLEDTMGIDFKHVFILSMNEKIFPSKVVDASFIPFTIRTEYEMTTPYDKSARHAYLYYRLLQRAEHIFCFYSTQTSDRSSSEKSRYLLQLLFDWQKDNSNIHIKETIVSAGTTKEGATNLTIEKTPLIVNRIKSFLLNRQVSPSIINTYLQCSLKFYFDHIAGLKAPQKIEDTVNEQDLGNLFHKAIYLCYLPYLDQPLTEALLNSIKLSAPENIIKAYHEYFSNSLDPQSGKAYYVSVILEYIISKVIDIDLESIRSGEEIRVLALEESLEGKIKMSDDFWVKMMGRADRIDRRGENVVILDYKTGEISLNPIHEVVDFISNFDAKKPTPSKLTNQALVYSFLLSQIFQTDNPIMAGFYGAKGTDKSIQWIGYDDGDRSITNDRIMAIELGLKSIFEEILNDSKPFSQTTEAKLCEYCPHVGICLRD